MAGDQRPPRGSPPTPMIEPFPTPGPLVQLAYRELNLAVNGTAAEREQLGKPARLPRPWEPATCLDPELRHQLLRWLEEVVIWLNREYTWDVSDMIPTCWPEHPHLVHEIAVVADLRRRAGLAATSDALEEWHRYCLPALVDRMRARLRSHCDGGHDRWPGRSRHSEHTDERHVDDREDVFAADVDALESQRRSRLPEPLSRNRFTVVQSGTGETTDRHDGK